jgi:subtilisin family serine protease
MNAFSSIPSVQVLKKSEVLPMLLVRVSNVAALARIRRLPWTDYVEPNFFDVGDPTILTRGTTAGVEAAEIRPLFSSDTDSSLGCSNPPEYSDFAGTVEGGDKYSWSYDHNGVVNAWRRSRGDNVRVALIDTGVDVSQPQFTSRFNAYPGASRSMWYLNVKPSSRYPDWTDDCGHGTRMAGIIAAPRHGQSIVGVAYESDFISIRVDDDPYVSNTWAVNDAIHLAMAPSQDADIVVMAFKAGSYDSESLKDIIRYYYHRTDAIGRRNGPLFIGAAGTSGTDVLYNGNVLFPADMAEVIAVSGVDAYGTRWSTSHHGPKVELAGYVPQATVGIPGIFGGSPTITRLVGSSGLRRPSRGSPRWCGRVIHG